MLFSPGKYYIAAGQPERIIAECSGSLPINEIPGISPVEWYGSIGQF
jgi:hypothetical protein